MLLSSWFEDNLIMVCLLAAIHGKIVFMSLIIRCSLAELLTHDVGSHLVEQLLTVLPSQLYDQVLQQLSGQLVTMAMHPTANFVLQSLIGQVHNEAQVRFLH